MKEMMKRKKRRFLVVLLAFIMLLGNVLPVFAKGNVEINKDSITIKSGEKYQLNVTVDGITKSAAWGSSDDSVASVDNTGLVTGKAAGTAVITAMVNGSTIECLVSVLKKTVNTTSRYNVLILDASGSMKGNPDIGQKKAAKRFCQKVLSTEGNNYVAVVALNSSPILVQGFSDNYSVLESRIDTIAVSGNTNIDSALSVADGLLSNVKKSGKVLKNIVLCSDGLPTVGKLTSSGRYKFSDHNKWYGYANASYNTAKISKNKGYFIYALGFFHNSKGNDLKFGKRFMKDLASKDKYFIIQDSTDLDHVFDDIANHITKTTINKTSLTLNSGSSYQLNAMIDGATKKASWSSSDSSVASVSSSGKVTAKKVGTAIISAGLNGETVTCIVTVKPQITLNKTKAVLYTGEKLRLKAVVKGSNGKIKWESSKTSIVTVSQKGVVIAEKPGKAIVSATVDGTTVRATITVKKAKHIIYAVYFTFPASKYEKNDKTLVNMDESGVRIVTNDGAVIDKCAVYLYKKGLYWHYVMAFKGTNVKSAVISGYNAYKGKLVVDGMTDSELNTFTMRKDASGIWSQNGTYGSIRENVTTSTGKLITELDIGTQSSNMKIFKSLSAMKKWLAK